MHTPLITQCILSLGSNYHPHHNLKIARELLQTNFTKYHNLRVKHIMFSPLIASEDKSNNKYPITEARVTPSPIYSNQVAWIEFCHPICLDSYTEFTKFLEHDTERYHYPPPIVTLDIDILAIQTTIYSGIDFFFHQYYQPLITLPLCFPIKRNKHSTWYAMSQRLPYASFDKYGINYLLNIRVRSNFLTDFLPIL